MYIWKWIERRRLSTGGFIQWKNPNVREPCQTCEAILPIIEPLKLRYVLEAIKWSNRGSYIYEARVQLNSNHIVSQDGFESRLEAQKYAEKLLLQFLQDSIKGIHA